MDSLLQFLGKHGKICVFHECGEGGYSQVGTAQDLARLFQLSFQRPAPSLVFSAPLELNFPGLPTDIFQREHSVSVLLSRSSHEIYDNYASPLFTLTHAV